MTRTWPVEDVEARFGALLEASVREGPQVLIRRGIETAILLPIAQWREMQQSREPSLKEALLAPEPRTEMPTPPRPPHS